MNESLEEYKKLVSIPDSMIWKGPALKQIENFECLAHKLGVVPVIVSYHTSKSIKLPVLRFERNEVTFYIRDNFYDINLCAVSPIPFKLTPSELLEGIQGHKDWGWYLEEIARCRGYTWSYFTDEEMEDPRILRAFKKNLSEEERASGRSFERFVSPEVKDRWLRRMVDPEWWSRDWASGTLSWDGEFGPGVKLYTLGFPYMEGISSVAPPDANTPYKKGGTMFSLALGNLHYLEQVIHRLSDPA